LWKYSLEIFITLEYNYSLTTQPNHYTNMKINFAQVPANDVDTFGDEGLFGPDESGDFYYNYVEYGTNPGGTDEVAIHDGCNRFMPIAVENIPDLIAALDECYKISQSLRMAEKTEAYVTSDTQAYVTETAIEYEPLQNTTSWPFHN
jgi:hypothetical protein